MGSLRVLLAGALEWAAGILSPEAPAGTGRRPAPPSSPDDDVLARIDALEAAVSQLDELPREWERTVADLDDALERLELKRRRLAATASKLKGREAAVADDVPGTNGGEAPVTDRLAHARALAARQGLV